MIRFYIGEIKKGGSPVRTPEVSQGERIELTVGPGQVLDRPVTDEDREKYAAAYEEFKNPPKPPKAEPLETEKVAHESAVEKVAAKLDEIIHRKPKPKK